MEPIQSGPIRVSQGQLGREVALSAILLTACSSSATSRVRCLVSMLTGLTVCSSASAVVALLCCCVVVCVVLLFATSAQLECAVVQSINQTIDPFNKPIPINNRGS